MTHLPRQQCTDWNKYYKKTYKTAYISRLFTIRHTLNYLKKYVSGASSCTITEFGGGNSCFYQTFQKVLKPSVYYIVDNNQTGLDVLQNRIGNPQGVILLNRDILNLTADWQSDIVYSVGLIEHYSIENTRKALLAHLAVLKPGGLLVIGFPTPTILYRISRKISQWLGLWIFHDERPLKKEEVLETLNPYGQILETSILWPIFLTQAFIVLRKY